MVIYKYHKGQRVIFTAKPNYDTDARRDSGKVATIMKCHGGVTVFLLKIVQITEVLEIPKLHGIYPKMI